MFYLRLCSGLCNRLRAMNAAYWLSKKVGCRLRCYWRIDDSMNVGFSTLFEPIAPWLEVIDVEAADMPTRIRFSRYNPFAFSFERRELFVKAVLLTHGLIPFALTDYTEFFLEGEQRYSWIRPRAHILKEIKRHIDKVGKDAIGVHIRRTDNAMAIKYSPLELFIERMEDLIEKNDGQRFFLATDDDKTKTYLCNRFGSRVYTRMDIAARADENGVMDAVVDLFMLAGCKMILGSYWSSFSEVAATIGWKPYVQIKTHDAPIAGGATRIISAF